VPDAPATATVETSDHLAAMAKQDASLLTLVRTLLHPRTLPHVLLLVLASSLLFLATQGGFTDASAVAFTSMALAYATAGVMSSLHVVRRWMALDPPEEGGVNQATTLGFARRLMRRA